MRATRWCDRPMGGRVTLRVANGSRGEEAKV